MNESKAKRHTIYLLSLIFTLSLAFLLFDDQRFFAYENRYLQQLPSFSLDDLFAGQYTKKFEKYVTDQFPFRKNWLQVKGMSEFILGKAENNGVYFGSDMRLFERLTIDTTQWNENIAHLLEFNNWLTVTLPQTEFSISLIPTSSLIYPQALPVFTNDVTQQQTAISDAYIQLAPIETIDVIPSLQAHAQHDKSIFFTTDHHWTQLGAFYGYEQIVNTLGFSSLAHEFWTWQDVSYDFYGSYFSKASIPFYGPDTITTAFSPSQLTYINLNNYAIEPLYSENYLSLHDQYGYFLNGTPSFARITNDSIDSDQTLLLIKDSYSHVIAPLLAEHYASITLIDLRFFNQSLRDYIMSEQFDNILFLVGSTTFNTNMQLGKLMR